ncbi:MAG: phosphoglucosamine mutase [Candidatus Epulonipiscioides saccharophilum]|nr:MAG: phosphoglucosamine mutase [Epulopiscium sp. AS2M-Bin001]
MGNLFGTDGVRGVANLELTGSLAFHLGQAGAYVLTKETHRQPKILVARDTRISGLMLESALVAGICSMGAKAICIGVVPTPAVAFLIRELGLDAGVMISASHNPVEFNGIKFFNNAGYKLRDELEDEIEELLQNTESLALPTGAEIGTWEIKEDVINLYVDYLCDTLPSDLGGLRVLLDCANGAASKVAPMVLKKLGAEIEVIHNKPNGLNINQKCGSTHMGDLSRQVVGRKMQVGIAFDGDADRCLAVDELGNIVDGDQIMSIVGLDMKNDDKLANNTIVATVMSNLGFKIMCEEQCINLECTPVGDRYVLENMLANQYNLGGEQSGHVIFLDYNTTGDGLLTAIQLLYVVKKTGKKLSELTSVMKLYPQVLRNAKVTNEKKYYYKEDEEIQNLISQAEAEFCGKGRVLIRPSGTEPLVRVMIEGENQNAIDAWANKISEFIEKKLS